MRVSEAVIDRLKANGIDTIFGIPGTQTLPLNEAVEADDGIRFVMARHETAVSHQAWGYAETGGGIAATLVVPGPGDTNAMNGLKNAHDDGTPLVHISIETEPEIRGGGGLHETPPDTYDNVVKENVTVETPSSTVAELERAIAIAETPPTGPVRVGIPRNFVGMDVELADAGEYDAGGPNGLPATKVDAAADLLADAEAPFVLAGGGVRRARAADELRALAESLDAPVATTGKGKGSFPEDHDLSIGWVSMLYPEMRSFLEDADAVLAVGTDLDATTTGGWSTPLPDDLIHVALHPDDIGRGYDPAVGVVADAGAVLRALSERLPGDGGGTDGAARAAAVRDGLDERLADYRAVSEAPLTSASVIEAAREALPRETVVTSDAGGLNLWMSAAFEAYSPGAYVNTGSWASMGTSLPSAIGAALANPDRDVVTMTGDGGLMMCIHELHTVVAEGISVVTLVCNNSDYAIISESAERDFAFEEGSYDWEGAPIDFTAAAESMGMDAVRVETTDGVREALSDALASEGPALIEVMTDPREPQAHHLLNE